MIPREGVDYAWGRPGAAALLAAGESFVARYLSRDQTGKNLSASEARELTAAGLSIVCVWESTARRALDGHTAGADDATEAARQAKACGMPDDRPIYFAVDFDAQPSDQPAINEYLRGAGAVLGPKRVGIYGGYWPCSRAAAAGVATWIWQTYAWSGGKWFGAHIEQYQNDVTINGVSCDLNRARVPDFGQWPIISGGDMPNPADLWSYPINVPDYGKDEHPGVPSLPAGAWLRGANILAQDARDGVLELAAKVADVETKLDEILSRLPAPAEVSQAAAVPVDAPPTDTPPTS